MSVNKVLARALYRGSIAEKDIASDRIENVKKHYTDIYTKEKVRISGLIGAIGDKAKKKSDAKPKRGVDNA